MAQLLEPGLGHEPVVDQPRHLDLDVTDDLRLGGAEAVEVAAQRPEVSDRALDLTRDRECLRVAFRAHLLAQQAERVGVAHDRASGDGVDAGENAVGHQERRRPVRGTGEHEQRPGAEILRDLRRG